MQKPDSLIRTKLRLPFTRAGLVSRPGLQAQIMQGLRGPLTLITAPAGFGKSTLVASCVTGCGMPVAWLSVDQHDNQPGRFLTYLVAALQSAGPRIGDEAAQLMAGIQQAPPEAVLTSLINDLDSAGLETALVLDDYHLITSPAVHEAVAFLLNHCPKTFHLVIATRSDPPLPLARLRARGQTLELRAADLRFTEDEAARFLNEVMGLSLDAGSVAALEARTEGWIAGLQMASIALQSHLSKREHEGAAARDNRAAQGFIEGFSGTNRFILDYLLEEVLASQPPEIQQFLLYTSILERLTAPLCDALLAGDELNGPATSPSAGVLSYLERENLFLILLEEDAAGSTATDAWFRYHHLFADLLRARLQQAQPGLVPRLHARASAWLEQNGCIPEAIQHRFAAREDDRAADLIERYGPACWSKGDPSVVQMADSLPPEMLLARPRLGLYLAWLLLCQGRVERALPLLNDLARPLASAEAASAKPASSLGWVQTVSALALAFLIPRASLSGPDPLADDRVLDEIPVGEPILRDAAEILYGMALARRGEIDRAAQVALKCIQKKAPPEAAPYRSASAGAESVPSLVPFLARIYLIQGRLHAAADLCREYLNPLKASAARLINSPGSMNIVLGEALYEWNCLDEAEQQIRDGLKANEPWRNIMTDGFGLAALACVLQARGDSAGALQAAAAFETRLQTPTAPREFEEGFRTLRVRLQLASGDLQSAAQWAGQVQTSEDFRRHSQRYQLTLARVSLALGRCAEAEAFLTSLGPQDTAGSRIARQIEINLLLAAALAGQGRVAGALELVEASLALAEPEGYIRVFLEAGEAARALLAAYLRSDAPAYRPFAQTLLDAFSPVRGAESADTQPDGLVEPLSERELEVLRLMAIGKTNPEIARQLVVADGTIKAHAASIYRKLDVANRTEAVARARALQILP